MTKIAAADPTRKEAVRKAKIVCEKNKMLTPTITYKYGENSYQIVS
jgi:hypothetical protein